MNLFCLQAWVKREETLNSLDQYPILKNLLALYSCAHVVPAKATNGGHLLH